jgi:hypothetical protein
MTLQKYGTFFEFLSYKIIFFTKKILIKFYLIKFFIFALKNQRVEVKLKLISLAKCSKVVFQCKSNDEIKSCCFKQT